MKLLKREQTQSSLHNWVAGEVACPEYGDALWEQVPLHRFLNHGWRQFCDVSLNLLD